MRGAEKRAAGSASPAATAAHIADCRRRVFGLYASVRQRAATDPAAAHAHWVSCRNELLASHPASPLLEADRKGFTGLPVAAYDPGWRFELPVLAADEPRRMAVETGTDGVIPFELLGTVRVPLAGTLEVWRLASYGGGLFVPVKDALAGHGGGTYGGGRYLIDTIKGADLGLGSAGDSLTAGSETRLVLDFNFAYNPSCAYDPAWACPLAQAGNTLPVEVPVGERYPGT
ncbi:hypothetical protein ATY41_09315 [Leifsonia xyli subsp. xyli]|uniref:DUF1684 domain-containing protein n=1 Tax=Leifsonia xyli subsp. xyli TaxID=59736 RepID=A0A1E2SLJ0_LEIXY|nr:DUF1684 domain-containing protein [Leifsonia xyli]ODA90617.1 hypothetical protein ATY41_09315 [Leifsonia xyli subsp. xyli]